MHAKIQGSGTIFRVGFALLKTPHLHRAYLVTVRKKKSMTVCVYLQEDIVIMANPIGESSWPFSVSAATSQGNFVEHVFIQLIDERKVQND